MLWICNISHRFLTYTYGSFILNMAEIAVLSQKVFQMQIADTGSTLELKHIKLMRNALYNELRHCSDLRDQIEKTQKHFNTHRGTAIGSLSKCISDLDLQVYETQYVYDYVDSVLHSCLEKAKKTEVTK